MNEELENRIGMGKAFLKTNMLDKAHDCFMEAMDDEDIAHEALFYLGVTCFKMGEYEKAVDYFKKLLEIRADSIHIYNNLALSLEKCHREKEALLVYDTGLEITPSSSLLLANRGVMKYKTEDYEGAVKDISKALKRRPGIAFLHFYLGLSLIKIGRLNDAKESLEEALAHSPDDETILNNLGYLSLKLGSYDQARKYLSRAIRTSSGLKSSYLNLAWLYTERGKLEMSLLMLRKAFPDNVLKIRNHLSRLSEFLARGGRGEEARYLAQRAIDITNGNSGLEQGIEK
jgi:tetratricopeptide (TPR) repeat protein